MKLEIVKIPLIVLGILLLASIIPIPLIALMYLNGGLFHLFSIEQDSDFFLINALLALATLYIFYRTQSLATSNFLVFLFVFFSLPVARYMIATLTYDTRLDPYSLFFDPFLIVGPLAIAAILRQKMRGH